MKPWGEVSSFRGANTLFEGQQINGQTKRRHRERRETQRRVEKRSHTQRREIKGAT
jgi:hypothetical protein